MEDGREIRTVEVDPVRGPIMKWAFEEYATGKWNLRDLLAEATKSTGGVRNDISLPNRTRCMKPCSDQGNMGCENLAVGPIGQLSHLEVPGQGAE